ncbi:hypothetical protein ASPWEDRAFT_39825 [Aspergillus wentii DTO 134E9]|uniref:ATP-dependent RNA helicase n=1 Tax=Aspergillus wentii DTO 134E9 TaxID=1073089 RepID=A0A1L9RIK8_ASPWE|nr:uncharacterized protein ASPWEDRAFT_39825 [Aspergillus wentii DTO 134E9]OJJ34741.1 hypothetical protein ASPWEDRAFT_39825 [Aspergillus wentii DTO 134E9]
MGGDKASRYGSSKKEPSTPQSAKKSHKRKRDLDGSAVATSTPTPTKKPKKSQSPSSTPVLQKESSKKGKRSKTTAESGVQEDATTKESAVSPDGSKAISSNANDHISKAEKKSKNGKRRASGNDIDATKGASNIDESSKDLKSNAKGESKVRKKIKTSDETPEEEDGSKSTKHKFSGILSKFERSKETAKGKKEDAEGTEAAETMTAEPVIAQGLEPLPQPEAPPEQVEAPTYSSLPPWLANPLRTSAEEKTKFSDLGIDSKLLGVLEENGYKEAFAVQSTVIPLLLPGPKKHSGDLCISAATGSGKTLSYVLPMVTALEQVPAPRLRGLIVVPTRELVKQAREACELCAAGSGLRIGSAVGNVAIKDEQHSIMRADQVYGPEIVKQRQQVKLTGEDWTNFNLQDYISEAGDLNESLPGYVHKPEPNVDILICTPGRLVDHLRYTKGFTLKYLQWLVIDEADRLLNESFQEWVDVVMNSLDARKAPETFGFSGKLLADLGLPIQSREPRKIILSATMTRDISKLNSLRLANPKMVVVGAGDHASGDGENAIAPSDEQFTLPPTIKEYAISIDDESKKPLYLLRLLQSHIKLDTKTNTKNVSPKASSDSEDTSSEGSSSDDTSSDDTSSDDTSSDDTSSDDTSSDDIDSSSDEDTSDSESDSSEDTSDSESESDSDLDSESESEEESSHKDGDKAQPARNTVLIFTKSSESASRLSRLLSLVNPSLASCVGTIIKSNKSSASRKTLTAYRQGKISVIVATDRASRGLDLESLTHVVNYDVPPSITTYVHRIGRTARAGKEGSAWTLVAHREGRWFTNQIAKGSDGKLTRAGKLERMSMKLNDMTDVKSKYRAALDVLETEVRMGGKVKSSKSEE